MKAAIISVILLSAVITIGFTQRKIKKLDIKEEGVSVKVSYQPILDKIESNGISVRVTPISTDELNKEFAQSNLRDGKFNYAHYDKSRDSYFLRKKRKVREKTDLEFLLDGIEWLEDNDQISEDEYRLLTRMIIADFIPDYKEPSEAETTVYSNPYLLGSVYMSVYRIELVNSTNVLARFNETIIIKSGASTLTNLSSQFLTTGLEQVGEMNINRSLTLERYNLVTPLLLPPNSTTVKYFAALPSDLTSDKLEIGITNFNQLMSWKAQIFRNEIDKKYSFFEFALSVKDYNNSTLDGITYSILSPEAAMWAYLGDRRLFINSEEIGKAIEVFTFCMAYDNLYFARSSDIIGSHHLDAVKNKRSKVTIKMEKISDVKRKVK